MLFRFTPVLGLFLLTPPSILQTRLSSDTNADYEAYLARVQPPLLQAARDKQLLPWLNSFSGDFDRVRKGEVPIHSLTPKFGQEVRDGIVHDWIGGIFMPGVTMDEVFAVIQNFDRQKDWYPEVIESKLLSKDGEVIRSRWLLLRKSLIEIVFNTELKSKYVELSPGQWLVESATTSVREIEEYGTKKAKQFEPGSGYGLMWRFNSYWTFQQRPEGVYGELRVISLSRQVPTGLGWAINPFIRSVPMQSVENTLVNTRKAVKKS